MSSTEIFGQSPASILQPMASSLMEAAAAVVECQPGIQDFMLPQSTLSVALQSVSSEAVGAIKGLKIRDLAAAFGTAAARAIFAQTSNVSQQDALARIVTDATDTALAALRSSPGSA